MYRQRAYSIGTVLVSGALMVAIASPVSAQLVVYDAATTARNTVTATVNQILFETQRLQHSKVREMARRLSTLTNLRKYVTEDVPRWRTHGGDFFFAQPYNDALIFGDPVGAAFTDLSQRLLADPRLLDRLGPAARRLVEARLGTVNLTDAAAIAATHGTGQLRWFGRKNELPAIDALNGTSLIHQANRARQRFSTRSAAPPSSAPASVRPAFSCSWAWSNSFWSTASEPVTRTRPRWRCRSLRGATAGPRRKRSWLDLATRSERGDSRKAIAEGR
jgi:hypothetical protein